MNRDLRRRISTTKTPRLKVEKSFIQLAPSCLCGLGSCLNLRSVSLRFSAYLCVPLRLRLFQRRGRGGTQRTADKKLKVRQYSAFVSLASFGILRNLYAGETQEIRHEKLAILRSAKL